MEKSESKGGIILHRSREDCETGKQGEKNSYLVKESEHRVSVFWEKNNMTAEEVGMAI